MRLKSLRSVALLFSALAGCTFTQAPTCSPDEHSMVLDTLYFGTAKPDGVVTAEEWAAFLSDTVTPTSPEGLTSWVASGQWKTSAGFLEQEHTYVLQLAHEEHQEKDRAVRRIIQIYKSRFQQEAVMRIRSRACRSF
jgi:hypothetical protein